MLKNKMKKVRQPEISEMEQSGTQKREQSGILGTEQSEVLETEGSEIQEMQHPGSKSPMIVKTQAGSGRAVTLASLG